MGFVPGLDAPAASSFIGLTAADASMSTLTPSQFQYEIGARLSRGDWDGAAAAAAGCRAAWPHDASGWVYGSMAALFADRKELALALIEERLRIDPDDVQCLIQKAECLFALGRRDAALTAAEAAAARAQGISGALDAIGVFLSFAADFEAAVRVFDQAVLAAPQDASILLKRAAAKQYLGRFAEAIRDYERALELSPNDAEALKSLAELRSQTRELNDVAAMQTALTTADPHSQQAAALHFGLAKAHEDLGDYPRSWQHLTTANAIERGRLKYDPGQDRATIDHIIAGFPHRETTTADTTGECPIFILGLPRTGTTLVERIIGSHSLVHSAGESSALADAILGVVVKTAPDRSTSVLGCIDAWGGLAAEAIARDYLLRIRPRRGDRPRFTDKTPPNFFYCALILRAFPKARIVHLTRHPLAACLAIYKMRFTGGFPFAYDLEELADFYIGYRRLMDHWHEILPGRILDVAYEDLVKSQDPATRRILEYVGLPFEPACLDFHLNPAATSTASSVQVRQPLYDSSLDRWRHYTAELEPVSERLAAAGIIVPA
jgi:tetratricopeptide (TPR) repeat protein